MLDSRVDYIDNIKALACALVAIGHFVMSMDASNILSYNVVTEWFKDTIYLFHVNLFFICSGFLYIFSLNQKNNYHYFSFVMKKLLALGIPYFFFTAVTVLLKNVAGDAVNTKANGLLYTLFIEPTPPYWYLYVLFFLFLIIPPLKSKKSINLVLAISLVLKIIAAFDILSNVNLPYFVTGIMNNSIWFVLGMALCIYKYRPKKSYMITGLVIFTIFILLSIVKYHFGFENKPLAFLLALAAVISIFMMFSSSNIKRGKITEFLIKYNMPVFLMHTIFAAGVRVVLMKIGINQWYIHIPVGLIITFIGPAIAAIIMHKTKFLEIFIYPTRVIKIN